MTDKINQTWVEDQDVNKEKSRLKEAAKIAVATAASLVIWSTQIQANDLLSQCDLNGDWRINTKADFKAWLVTKEIAKWELNCEADFNISEWEKRISEWEKRIEKLEEISNLLSKK